MTAIFRISDGTTAGTVSLLDERGFHHSSWRPVVAQYKGGGSWRESSLTDGRRIVQKVYGNVIEQIDLKLWGGSQDSLIHTMRRLRQLLEKASDYWVDRYANEPVWIEAKATDETNTRYAIIHSAMIPDDGAPFAQPFLQADCTAVMDGLTLIVERGHWMDNKPGQGECVEISGIQESWGVVTEDATFAPTANSDDCYVEHTANLIYDGVDVLVAGKTTNVAELGVRFRNVTIAAGATIIRAAIRFTSYNTTVTVPCYFRIQGEDEGTPAAFSTYTDFVNRERTSAYVDWEDVPPWVIGATYDSPDVTGIVQEIVDRGDWATGQDIVMFMKWNPGTAKKYVLNSALRYAAAFEHASLNPPQLIVDYVGTPLDMGRAATCNDNEVYVVNKHNIAQLTHVGVDDGGVWQGNLLGGGVPFDLFPAVPLIGDAICFGIDTAVDDAGPFNNLVFDIGTIQSGLEIDWYYSIAGDAWSAFALSVQDNTNADGAMTGEAFDTPNVNSVHWEQPVGWVASDPLGIAVDAYWIRAEITNNPAGATVPTQQNRDVYTVNWPYIEVNEDQIGGDIDLQWAFKMYNECGVKVIVANIVGGLRSVSRGEDYTAYINLGVDDPNIQNPEGITISYGANTVANLDATSPTGVGARYTPAAAMQVEITAGLDSTIAWQYVGDFHAFLRYTQTNTGSDYTYARLTARNSDTGEIIFRSDIVGLYNTNSKAVADFGKFLLSPVAIAVGGIINTLDLEIELGGTGPTCIDFFDLILIPTDEYAFQASNRAVSSSVPGVGLGCYLDIDGIIAPKRMVCVEKTSLDNSIQSLFTYISPWRPFLRWDGGTQRVWFFSQSRLSATYIDDDHAPIHGSFSLRNKAVKQYASMRGSA